MNKLPLAALLALSLSACQQSNDVLVVGTNATFPPFEYMGGTDGSTVIGFDIDLAKQIAKDAGKTLKVENMNFDSLIVALNKGKIDFIASGMTITPERQANVDFSEPYYEATQAVLVKVNNTTISTEADLKEKKIGVQLGSTGDIMAKSLTPAVTAFNSGFEAVMELNNGKIDAVIFDKEPAQSFLAKNPTLKQVPMTFTTEYYGFAVSKDNPELVATINQSLSKMKANGEYQSLLSKYMK